MSIKNERKHREGRSWFRFVRGVVKPIDIEDIAARLGVTVDEALTRAEVDVKRGKLLAFRGADGTIRAVGRRAPAPPKVEAARWQAQLAEWEAAA